MAALDFDAVSPGFHTAPRERLAAHLAHDLRRQYPHLDEGVHFYRLACDLVDELVQIAAGYRLEDYGLPALKRRTTTDDRLEQLADY